MNWDPILSGITVAYDGSQCVELDSFDPTTISQAVPTIPGMEYELIYAWMPRPDADCAMAVIVNASTIAMHNEEDFIPNSCGWRVESYTFVAPSESSLIAFAELGPDEPVGGLGMLLDAVSLVNLGPLGCDSATGDGVRILSKGNWFMCNEYLGDGVTYDIQAGNPKNGTNIIGRFWIDDMGLDSYRANYDIDDTIEIDGIVYDIVVTEEHLAISDSKNFKAKPGHDDNADFDDGEGDLELFSEMLQMERL